MSDTQLKAIPMRPGIDRDTTEYGAEGGWVDCDKIRFRGDRAEKIGGWVRETLQSNREPTSDLFTGVARDLITWNDLQFNKYIAVGTHQKLELVLGNIIYDITPVRETRNLTDVITTVSGESEVTINNSVPHNLTEGDFIEVTSQQTVVDGITLDGQYQVTQIVDANNFKVDSGTNAAGATSGGGGSLDINFLLENGSVDNGQLTGWGGGTWGTPGLSNGGWNRPRDGSIGGVDLRQWSLDSWGEDLIACVREGKIYQWDATNGVNTRAQELTNAPTRNNFILVGQPFRHLIAFGSEVESTGAFDPLIIRWASQETLTEWGVTATNSAGEFRIPDGNEIIGAVQTRTEIIVFTDVSAYSMAYIGGNQVFQFTPLGSNMSAISQHAAVDINGTVFWMGKEDFYLYDGVVRVLPTTISKFIFDQDGEGQYNENQKEKIFAGVNKEFHEIWWFYPGQNSKENNRYIKYNYQMDVWDFGTIDRTVWVDRGIFDRPLAVESNGRLFLHESGKNADAGPMNAFIQSAFFDIGDGERFMFVDRVVPDLDLAPNRNALITLEFKRYPTSAPITKGPFTFNNTMDQIKFRGRGRQANIKYQVNAIGADFELGKTRIGMQNDGER